MKIPKGHFGDILLVDGGLSPMSLAIKRRTLSDWSHVARFVDKLFPSELVAIYPHKSRFIIGNPADYKGVPIVEAIGQGVCVRDSAVYAKLAWRVRTYAEPLDYHAASTLRNWELEQVGKPYDWPQVLFGFVLRKTQVDPNQKRWFCSEHQAAGDWVANRVVIADTDSSLVPPHLYAATSGLKTTDWHIREPYGWKDEK